MTFDGSSIIGDYKGFVTEAEDYPNVEIYIKPKNVPADKEFFFKSGFAGCLTIYVKSLNEKIAIKVLAAINNVPCDEIILEQEKEN